MSATIMVEGYEVEAKRIPQQHLEEIWKKLTSKPFPKVKAFQLEDEDFDSVMRLRKCKEDEERELEEWGRVLPIKGTDACVFSDGESAGIPSQADYVILIRENPYHIPEEILKHELSHIARGDL